MVVTVKFTRDNLSFTVPHDAPEVLQGLLPYPLDVIVFGIFLLAAGQIHD